MPGHFYTVDPLVASRAITQGYHLKGVACYVYDPKSNQPGGTTALFRLYFTELNCHFYIIDPNEAQTVLTEGFNDEGTACYVDNPGQAVAGTVPLYRLFNG